MSDEPRGERDMTDEPAAYDEMLKKIEHDGRERAKKPGQPIRKCATGKIPFSTPELAERSLKALKREGRTVRKRQKTLNVYQCRSCGQYHVGHKRPRRKPPHG